jgi:hypothetical protein
MRRHAAENPLEPGTGSRQAGYDKPGSGHTRKSARFAGRFTSEARRVPWQTRREIAHNGSRRAKWIHPARRWKCRVSGMPLPRARAGRVRALPAQIVMEPRSPLPDARRCDCDGRRGGAPCCIARDPRREPQRDSLHATANSSRIEARPIRPRRNNCEHFCEWCLRGKSRSYQVERFLACCTVLSGFFGLASRLAAKLQAVEGNEPLLSGTDPSARRDTAKALTTKADLKPPSTRPMLGVT